MSVPHPVIAGVTAKGRRCSAGLPGKNGRRYAARPSLKSKSRLFFQIISRNPRRTGTSKNGAPRRVCTVNHLIILILKSQ
jgi:hypothetical protein